jgi:hypothetical protein
MKERPLSKKILKNIRSIYERANEDDRLSGLYWYQTAQNDAMGIALKYGFTVEQIAGIISAVSPSNPWGKNLQDAEKLAHAHANNLNRPSVGTYGNRNLDKATRILNGAPAAEEFSTRTGPKTHAFFHLIFNPDNDFLVCVDRHARAIALNEVSDSNSIVRPYEFKYIARHYREVARELNLLPHQLQAITWLTWLRLYANGHSQLDKNPF